jgi:predicted dehydrogenase
MIGCGDVTEVKSGPGFQKARNSSLVAVMRRNGNLARDYAERHQVPRWYDDASALIHDPEVDAVYIATPPSSHKEYTLLVAEAGKPVYVEKPMALTFAECQEMIEACRAAGVPLFVAYYRRALPRFLKVKELVEAGAIGEVRLATMTLHWAPAAQEQDTGNLPWRVLPEISGGGRFVDVASHTLDFMDYVLGPIRAVASFAGNQAGLYPAEDTVTAAFMFESGAQASGSWCFTASGNYDMTEIIGTKGRVTFSTTGVEPIRLETGAGVNELPIDNPAHVQQPLIQTIVDELNGEGQCPSPAESGARTTWVIDEILKAYRQALVVEKLPGSSE